MTDGMKFAYLRDPANHDRVVTLAWTQKLDDDKLDVRYAFAVNRVASPHNRPERTKSGLQKHHDRHCRKIGRAVAAGRYRGNLAPICINMRFDVDKPVIESIIDDYLLMYDHFAKLISEELLHLSDDKWITPILRLKENEKLKRLSTLRRTIKEVFERIKAWNDRQVR